MKKILFFFAAALVIVGCEKEKKVADAKDMTISFEYRSVASDSAHSYRPHFEFRNTTTPEYARPDFWWYFKNGTNDIAPFIGESGHRYAPAGTYVVTLQYKPGVSPNYDSVYAVRTFSIDVTATADSVWTTAIPKEE